MDEQTIREIIRQALAKEMGSGAQSPVAQGACPSVAMESPAAAGGGQGTLCRYAAAEGDIPLEVSARHAHLTAAAVEALFGPGAKLAKKRDLSQPGEFLSHQRVKLVTPKGVMENVAVLGPERGAVQVELSATDCRALGIQAPVNLSGDLTNAGDVMIVGERGCINAPASVIVAKAHVHMTPANAKAFGVKDGERVGIRIKSARPVTLEDVVVRVRENFALACHIDFDEANAAAAQCGAPASLLVRGGSGGAEGRDAVSNAPSMPAAEDRAIVLEGKLVTEETAKSVRAQGGTVRIKKGVIITPAARDVFSNAQMKVEFV